MIYKIVNKNGIGLRVVCGHCGEMQEHYWWRDPGLTCDCEHTEETKVEIYKRRIVKHEYHYFKNWLEETIDKGIYICHKYEKELFISTKKEKPTLSEVKIVDTLTIDINNGEIKYKAPKGRENKHSPSRLSRFLTHVDMGSLAFLPHFIHYIRNCTKGINSSALGAIESMCKLSWNHYDISNLITDYLLTYEGKEKSLFKILGLRAGEEKYILPYQNGYCNNRDYILGFLAMDRKMKDWMIRVHQLLPDINYRQIGIMSDLRDLYKANYSADRLVQYVTQDVVWQGLTSPREVLGILRDTVSMVNKMDGAKLNKFPKSLKLYHDITAMNYKAIEEEITSNNFIQRTSSKEYKSLEWENDKYIILTPNAPSDLVKEGQSMNHCVASYIDRVANGESDIYFLRKKSQIDKSLVTIEVCQGNIEQTRGKANSVPYETERIVLREWKKIKGLTTDIRYLRG